MKAIYLATSYKGPAQSVLGDLGEHQRRNFPALVVALEARFGTTHQTELYRSELRGRTSRTGETLPELAQSIRRLVRQAYLPGICPLSEHKPEDFNVL